MGTTLFAPSEEASLCGGSDYAVGGNGGNGGTNAAIINKGEQNSNGGDGGDGGDGSDAVIVKKFIFKKKRR